MQFKHLFQTKILEWAYKYYICDQLIDFKYNDDTITAKVEVMMFIMLKLNLKMTK